MCPLTYFQMASFKLRDIDHDHDICVTASNGDEKAKLKHLLVIVCYSHAAVSL